MPGEIKNHSKVNFIKMKKIVLTLSGLFLILTVFAQSRETRNLRSFNEVSISEAIRVELVKGNSEIVEAIELKENEQIYGPILLGYPRTDPGEAVNRALERICPIKKEPITKWI